ncbi:hypothetical protein GCM10023232_19890 [Sphingosinicella ginsenosidimutans]|uniref:Uncharacterized protein n=1 Tax=Allosphingosinicella ginsenosidimutans TaxID=1176539 RepID=A0A5C6TS02_9SPHN|nr:hypothetical protein [Sphingosinicella ginsenosidimutans]TXC63016.1 hypothetical protein FRZ32_04640 [Sphingosinicella ginsenosidimutans]
MNFLSRHPDKNAPHPRGFPTGAVESLPGRFRASPIAAPDEGPAVESWENEGGQFPAPHGVAITPTDVSLAADEAPTSRDALVAMRAKFAADFADGLMGQRYNTFEHRSRILRQMAQAEGLRDAKARPR